MLIQGCLKKTDKQINREELGVEDVKRSKHSEEKKENRSRGASKDKGKRMSSKDEGKRGSDAGKRPSVNSPKASSAPTDQLSRMDELFENVLVEMASVLNDIKIVYCRGSTKRYDSRRLDIFQASRTSVIVLPGRLIEKVVRALTHNILRMLTVVIIVDFFNDQSRNCFTDLLNYFEQMANIPTFVGVTSMFATSTKNDPQMEDQLLNFVYQACDNGLEDCIVAANGVFQLSLLCELEVALLRAYNSVERIRQHVKTAAEEEGIASETYIAGLESAYMDMMWDYMPRKVLPFFPKCDRS